MLAVALRLEPGNCSCQTGDRLGDRGRASQGNISSFVKSFGMPSSSSELLLLFGRSSFTLVCIQRVSVELCTGQCVGAVDTQLNRCHLWDQAGQSLTQEINQKTEDEISDFNVSDIERTGESGIWSGFGVRLSL